LHIWDVDGNNLVQELDVHSDLNTRAADLGSLKDSSSVNVSELISIAKRILRGCEAK
jgi:hypothetical protein